MFSLGVPELALLAALVLGLVLLVKGLQRKVHNADAADKPYNLEDFLLMIVVMFLGAGLAFFLGAIFAVSELMKRFQ